MFVSFGQDCIVFISFHTLLHLRVLISGNVTLAILAAICITESRCSCANVLSERYFATYGIVDYF